MLTIPEIKTGPVVKTYANDEIHIILKASGRPEAILSFVAVDDNGQRVDGAPVPIVTLKGLAYNTWYAGWDSERSLYTKALEVLMTGVEGASLSGASFSAIGGTDKVVIPNNVEEVINTTDETPS